MLSECGRQFTRADMCSGRTCTTVGRAQFRQQPQCVRIRKRSSAPFPSTHDPQRKQSSRWRALSSSTRWRCGSYQKPISHNNIGREHTHTDAHTPTLLTEQTATVSASMWRCLALRGYYFDVLITLPVLCDRCCAGRATTLWLNLRMALIIVITRLERSAHETQHVHVLIGIIRRPPNAFVRLLTLYSTRMRSAFALIACDAISISIRTDKSVDGRLGRFCGISYWNNVLTTARCPGPLMRSSALCTVRANNAYAFSALFTCDSN